ncbi:hypothetical protein JCM21900_003445 [Sporobolomyces salmonicolor]
MAPRPPSWSQGRKYGVVIDAGSSGSRVQVYSWIEPELAKQQRKAKGLSADVLSRVEKGVEEGDGWHLKVEPGISTFGDRAEGVAEYLKPLVDFAASVIPAEQLPSTPIYLLATAGMRLLPSSQQSAVLNAACSYIQSSYSFHLTSCADQVRIISGEEEGLYGWIAVNYLMDGFDKHEHTAEGERRKHSSTYGFLDMGGASTQIAFEPSDTEQVRHADNLLEVKLRLLSGKDVRHPVFVTTWLGFGTNQARNRYVDQEIRAHLRASDDAHKHFLPGNPEGLGTERPVILIDDPCLPKSLMLSEARHAGYTLKGTGDFASCVQRTGSLLNKEVECIDQPCLFNGVHVPPIDFNVNHFIGISEYWYSTQDVWGPANGAGKAVYDYVEFEKNAIEFCGKEWDDIMRDYKEGSGRWRPSVELSRLETQCFKAAWIVNILHEGIGIPRIIDRGGQGDGRNQTEKGLAKAVDKGLTDEPPSFQSLNEVQDVAISWTLGKMVLEVSKGSTQLPSAVSSHALSNYPSSSPSTSFPSSANADFPSHPSLATDWSGHIPSFKSSIRTSISSLKDSAALPYGSIFLIALALYFFLLSPTASRRRKSFCGLGALGRGGRRGRDFDFLPLSQQDESNGNGEALSPAMNGTRIPGGGPRKPSLPSTALGRVAAPFRYAGWRVSSTLRSWTRSATSRASPLLSRSPASAVVLPLARSVSETELYRPRPVRASKSTPFLRGAAAGAVAGTAAGGSGSTYYNDAPDLPFPSSERDRPLPSASASLQSASTLSRSHSSVALSSHSPHYNNIARTSSPPPMTTIIPPSPVSHPLSLSRPTTPFSSSTRSIPGLAGLSKLTPRSCSTPLRERESLEELEIPPASSMSASSSRLSIAPSPTSAVSPLASAVWDSLAREHAGSPTPGVGAGGGGGAKLRASRSANSSQVNLASGYFAGGSGSASSTNLSGGGGEG